MSETLFPQDQPVELEIVIGGMEFVLTHANTEIYTYRRHPEVNHVYHQYFVDHQDKQMAVFDSDDLIEQLRGLNFPERIPSTPTSWDESAFLTHQRIKLERELDEL